MTRAASFHGSHRWIRYKNSSGSTVPPGGVLQVTDFDGQYLDATVPDLWGVVGWSFAVNGLTPCAANAKGVCTFDVPTWVAYDTADGTPGNNDRWGPVVGSFKLTKKSIGFVVIGGAASGKVLVDRDLAPQIDGKLDAQIIDGGSAAFSVWYHDGAAFVDTTFNVTVEDKTDGVWAATTWCTCILDRNSQKWRITSPPGNYTEGTLAGTLAADGTQTLNINGGGTITVHGHYVSVTIPSGTRVGALKNYQRDRWDAVVAKCWL